MTPKKRAALRMLMIAPAVLILGVVVQSKPDFIDSDLLVSSSEAEERISNYIDIVKTTEEVTASPRASREDLRDLAHQWVQQSESGVLQPLPIQGSVDSAATGVKGQILGAARTLGARLFSSADKMFARGSADEAADDLVLAALSSQGLRYSDITSVSLVGAHQRRMLRRLEAVWPTVSAAKKLELKGSLEALRPDVEALDKLERVEDRFARIEWARNEEIRIASDPEAPKTASRYSSSLPALRHLAQQGEEEQAKILDKLVASVKE